MRPKLALSCGLTMVNCMIVETYWFCFLLLSSDIQRVLLQFENFTVQASANCSRDRLVVADTKTGEVLHTLCGHSTLSDVISPANSLSVAFRTDSSVTLSGFIIRFSAMTFIPGRYSWRWVSIRVSLLLLLKVTGRQFMPA